MNVQAASRPLFERYPGIARRYPFVALADLPTPVRRLARIEESLGAQSIWLKDDGVSSPEYGGNKVRKLELLLAAALARRAPAVLTFGYAGSNHAAATAVHASRVGLRSISMLLPQHNAAYLRKNLLVSSAVGADIHEYQGQARLVGGTLLSLARTTLRSGRPPYIIAPGGSSPLGTIGFVNAAFELAEQFDSGLLPVPARIYAAAGSLGTVVGLGIGLAALGLPTKVTGVRVVDRQYVNRRRAAGLWSKTVAMLRGAEPAFPDVAALTDPIDLRHEFYGGTYAAPTSEGSEAAALANHLEGLPLDVTYTAKALACLIADARSRTLEEPALFWNTCNSADLSTLAGRATRDDLAPRLQRYFEEE